jgi:osmotically inducible lipoprotein OsmB
MKTLAIFLISFFMSLSLSSCANMSRQDQGMIGGGVIGGVAGGAITRSPIGAAVGAVGGGLIGRQVYR